MLDASGLYRIRYGDIFRAVGHFLDTSLFRDLTLVETQDGFIVKGGTIRTGDTGTGFVPQSYLFTDQDLDTLLDQAIERRGGEQSVESMLPSITVDGERVRYEDALRSIGLLVDRIGWHEVVLIQTSLGFHLKGVSKEAPIDRLIDAPALKGLLEEMRNSREVQAQAQESPRRRLWPR
ncbi:MAG TPA: hypothetical protein VFV93_15675 [Thermomicrobiales bacterium]|nr:hypothetical protein [Thermomicrobiales bacterium]